MLGISLFCFALGVRHFCLTSGSVNIKVGYEYSYTMLHEQSTRSINALHHPDLLLTNANWIFSAAKTVMIVNLL